MGIEIGLLQGAFLAANAIGTGLTVAGQIQQAEAAQRASQFQAQIAMNNQAIAQANARAAQTQAEAEAARTSQAASQRQGKMLAMMGASGIDIGSGSFEDVMSSQQEADRLSALNTRYSGTARAIEMENAANNFSSEASLRTMTGQNAMNALPFQVGGTIASSVSNFAPRWREFERNR